ncbi:hypothetical protein B5807_02981 [Epicoccum nigrum]|uniref:Uncharacterized protein n=1 Tax=Epicoccum nigrum TaxID=105696 RepID=A0A1Y2MAH3_EPING|nr:hypothetical protein B5807_02981 [Epicoccum nigrum]
MAKTRRFIRNLDCARSPTSYAYLAIISCGLTARNMRNSHGTCPFEIYVPISVDKLGITDVAGTLFWAEANPAWPSKFIGDDSDIPRVRVKAIHLVWQLRRGPHALVMAVHGVSEVETSVRMQRDVFERVEAPSIVVVHYGADAERIVCLHVYETSGVFQIALSAEHDAVEHSIVVGDSARRVANLVRDLTTSPLAIEISRHLADDCYLVLSCRETVLITRNVEHVVSRHVYTTLVGEGEVFFKCDFQIGASTEYTLELLVVYKKHGLIHWELCTRYRQQPLLHGYHNTPDTAGCHGRPVGGDGRRNRRRDVGIC